MVIVVLLLIGAALVLISYMNNRQANRREAEHDRRAARFENLMEILQKNKEDQQQSNTDTNEKGDK